MAAFIKPMIRFIDDKVKLLDDPVGQIRWRNRIVLYLGPALIMALFLYLDQNNIAAVNMTFGLRPRSFSGLIGLIGAPWLHGNWEHLKGNMICWLVLMPSVMTYTLRVSVYLFWFISVGGGLFTWVVAQPNSVHVGVSGVLFGYMGFLMTAVFWMRPVQFEKVASLILTFFAFGHIMFSAFDLRRTQPGVSWEGHFFGCLAGMAFAVLWYYNGMPWNKDRQLPTHYTNVAVKGGQQRLVQPPPYKATTTTTTKTTQPASASKTYNPPKKITSAGGKDIYRPK
eukprot:GDKI01035889.1.p1 GENE.GDKI01035889.1~~GDKI01035889.1.p1  ORF type:complete len:282 (+),score=32.63 GDKI01035889.1:151-996(+)